MAHNVKIINGKAPSAGSGGVTDADLSNIAVNFFSKGVVQPNDYKLEQQSTPNMTVKVNTGKAYVPNSTGAMLYVTELEASANATIGNNASGNPRIDAIVIRIDVGTTPNSTASNIASLVVVPGTPAASPSAPNDVAIQAAVGAGNPFYRLGNVTVANGAASITNANIASTRDGVILRVVGGYIRYNLSTSKLQFSDDGVTFYDAARPSTAYQVLPDHGQTTTSTSFVDMTNGTESVILTQTSNVLAIAHANVLNSTNNADTYIRVTYDSGGGDTEVGTEGYAIDEGGSSDGASVTAGGVVESLAPGTYTFAVQKQVSAGTGTFYRPSLSILVLPA